MLALCAAGGVLPASGQVLEVSGATTVQRRVLEPGADALKAATGIQLKIYGPGTGKGMLALFDGKVPVAAAGESLEDAVHSAKAAAAETGRDLKVPADLVYHQVAADNIVVAVSTSARHWSNCA
jgi:ABC-type phosphate transport system substrate-binding protein